MLRKLACVAVLLALSVGLVMAEDFGLTVSKVDGAKIWLNQTVRGPGPDHRHVAGAHRRHTAITIVSTAWVSRIFWTAGSSTRFATPSATIRKLNPKFTTPGLHAISRPMGDRDQFVGERACRWVCAETGD